MNIYHSNTYRKDLSRLHFNNEPRVQEKQKVKDQQSRIALLQGKVLKIFVTTNLVINIIIRVRVFTLNEGLTNSIPEVLVSFFVKNLLCLPFLLAQAILLVADFQIDHNNIQKNAYYSKRIDNSICCDI